jgi:hypothetical protein
MPAPGIDIALETASPLLLLGWLLCLIPAFLLARLLVSMQRRQVVAVWLGLMVLMLVAMAALLRVGTEQQARDLHGYIAFMLLFFPLVLLLFVVWNRPMWRHVALWLGSLLASIPLTLVWLSLFP